MRIEIQKVLNYRNLKFTFFAPIINRQRKKILLSLGYKEGELMAIRGLNLKFHTLTRSQFSEIKTCISLTKIHLSSICRWKKRNGFFTSRFFFYFLSRISFRYFFLSRSANGNKKMMPMMFAGILIIATNSFSAKK